MVDVLGHRHYMVNGKCTRALTFQNVYQEIEQLNDDLDRLAECNQNLSDEIATLKEEGGGRGGVGNERGGADVQALETQLEHARQVDPRPSRLLPTRHPLHPLRPRPASSNP